MMSRQLIFLICFFCYWASIAQIEWLENRKDVQKYTLFNETHYVNKDSSGVKKFYSNNGQLIQVYYRDSLRIQYYESGNKKSITHYKNGYIEGERVYYHSNGIPEMILNYRKGLQDGPFILYYQNGQVQFEGEYKGGRMWGERTCYDEKGKLINGHFSFYGIYGTRYEGNCVNGKPEGELKMYDNTGIIMLVNFKNGKPDGLTYHYTNGKIIKAENYALGQFVDDVPY